MEVFSPAANAAEGTGIMSGPPIKETLELLARWAQAAKSAPGVAGVYVFGSLVHRDGAQFADTSDIDLVVVIPPAVTNAITRTVWLEQLAISKQGLEKDLAKFLGRPDPTILICSVLAPTVLEIEADVHKDGARGFFQENLFFDLLTGQMRKGLPGAASKPIEERMVVECLRFAQKKRNAFLAVSAAGTLKLPPFDDEEPLPKDIMRHGAMAEFLSSDVPNAETQYDTQVGLDFLTHVLYERRNENALFKNLHDRVSVRRGGRGAPAALSSADQLLLSELIYGQAVRHLIEAARKKAQAQPRMGHSSLVEFSNRFAQAFPGVRGVIRYTEPADIRRRLEKLLKEPLVYSDGTPIGWWRGDRNLHIQRFRYIEDNVCLMDIDELKIRMIAAANYGNYKRQFVYVEVDGMLPTGLYKSTAASIAEVESGTSDFPFSWEEYGIVDGKYLVTRAQLDDGAAEIDGKLEDTRGRTELRARYVTPYNFVIAAMESPINNGEFDSRLEMLLDVMLKGQDVLDQLAKDVLRLPIRNY